MASGESDQVEVDVLPIRTEFVLPSATLRLIHERTTGDGGRTGPGLLITEEAGDPNTLTTLEISLQDRTQTVYFLWDWERHDPGFSMLFVPETSVLFAGAGTFSVVIDIRDARLIRRNYVDLFWGFQHTPRSILELGECDCSLYRRNGELLGTVPVDPPYEVVVGDHCVEIATTLFGVQRLPFPS